MPHFKLSILDQSLIGNGKTAADAIQESLELALLGEELGYERYWLTEHHNIPGFASSSSEILLTYIGAHTHSIRIGSGAILLPYYKPYKIAEQFNMLATLYHNRVDLGLGRAPGGSAQVSMALSNNFLEGVRNFPNKLEQLLRYLQNKESSQSELSNVIASPIPEVMPEPWLLGTSEKSAILAAEKGISYAFGQFMSEKDGPAIINRYLKQFNQNGFRKHPYVIITVNALCAQTTTEAEALLEEHNRWTFNQSLKKNEENTANLSNIPPSKIIYGNPEEVKEQLVEMKQQFHADEIMINSVIPSIDKRLISYKLIANQFFI